MPVSLIHTTGVDMDWKRWRPVIVAVLTLILGLMGGAATTQVAGCGRGPDPHPHTDPPPEPSAEPDPWNAIGKIAMQGGYCSGTVIGPRRPDGRWIVVSAAHCVSRVGEEATFIQRTGVTRRVVVMALNKKADIALFSTEAGQGQMSFTNVAQGTPQIGTRIFHGGFGRHIPGNREEGQVLGGPNNDGQVKYQLSVSPGDSGGGICMTADGLLLSPVCCTTRLDGPGEVWGGSPEMINRMLTSPTEYIELQPIPMPPAPKEMPAKAP